MQPRLSPTKLTWNDCLPLSLGETRSSHATDVEAHLDCVLLGRLEDSLALGDLQQAGGVYRKVHAQFRRLAVLGPGIIDACRETPQLKQSLQASTLPVCAVISDSMLRREQGTAAARPGCSSARCALSEESTGIIAALETSS